MLTLSAMPCDVMADEPEDLLELTIEELGEIQVSSVSRRPETINEVAASVYVITREEIQRSGVTSIPEALRLAPGVEVARDGGHSWTISMRGFSNNLSNKLLVLIDGRSVYSPLYAGVFWDVQDTLLEDIDRIEVIAGPGGSVWGANAVNGVINIITRAAWETQGAFVELGAGNERELVAGVRYGGTLGSDFAYRAYVKHFEQDETHLTGGGDAHDAWDMQQAGFRTDWALSETDSLTVQGDIYDGREDALVVSDFTLGTLPDFDVPDTIDVAGGNVLARWERQLQDGGSWHLQGYYDRTSRDIPGNFAEKRDTGDLEFVHDLPAYGRHEVIWGAGFRVTSDHIDGSAVSTFDPADRTDETYSVFVQDRIALRERELFLTLGTKYEHNDYSGSEHQPTARLLWLPRPNQSVWGAISRAVRIPARLNEDLNFVLPLSIPGIGVPVYVNVRGNESFKPEELVAYEAGYRLQWRDDVSVDLTVYLHDYDHLMTTEAVGEIEVVPGPPAYLFLPAVQANGLYGEVYGGTLDMKWQVLPHWRLEFQYSRTEFDLDLREGARDEGALDVAGNSPKNQAALYSYLQIARNLSLYAGVRYVDELPSQNVPSYTALDANLNWRLTPGVTASLTIRNLTDPRHPEFGDGSEIERSVLARLDWRF